MAQRPQVARRFSFDPHPLALPLLAGVIAGILWSLHYFFGFADSLYQLAVGGAAFYGAAFLFTMIVGGIGWCVVKLVRLYERK